MGGASSTHGRDEKCVLNLRGRDHSEDDLREIKLEGADWMHMAQDRDQWRAAVNTVINL